MHNPCLFFFENAPSLRGSTFFPRHRCKFSLAPRSASRRREVPPWLTADVAISRAQVALIRILFPTSSVSIKFLTLLNFCPSNRVIHPDASADYVHHMPRVQNSDVVQQSLAMLVPAWQPQGSPSWSSTRNGSRTLRLRCGPARFSVASTRG
jgi:hypothetical protein